MDITRSSNSVTLLTPQETAQKLGVSLDTLLLWNSHHILTPTISPDGVIGYSEAQINYFQSIQRFSQQPDASFQENMREKNGSEESTPRFSRMKSLQMIREHASLLLGTTFVGFALGLTIFFGKNWEISQLFGTFINHQGSVLGVQTSNLDFVKNTMPSSISFGGEITSDENLHSYTTNSSFSLLLQEKNEKVTNSTHSAQALADRMSQLQANKLALKNTPSQIASTSEEIKTDNASTISTVGDTNPYQFSLDLGTPTKTNSIKANALTTFVGAALILSIMLLFFQSQFAFFVVDAQEADIDPASQIPQDERIIRLEQKVDGSVVAIFQDKEYKICKPELYSDSDQFIERLMKLTSTNEREIEYDSFTDSRMRVSTPLSRIVTRLNFVGIKRDLFFPRTSKNRVLFRRFLTYQDLMTMNLTVHDVIDVLTNES